MKDSSSNTVCNTAIVEGSGTVRSRPQLLQIVDTTLLKCYLQVRLRCGDDWRARGVVPSGHSCPVGGDLAAVLWCSHVGLRKLHNNYTN